MTTAAKIEDLWPPERGSVALESVRRVQIDEALVDPGAMILSLPTSVIQ